MIDGEAAAYLTKTRIAYDVVAADYHVLLQDEIARTPWERAMLGGFAEIVEGPVVDVGCGPGRITGPLADLGVEVSGIDLSPRMVEVAREVYPAIPFRVGSLLDLDLPDASLGGLVSWYSLVHTPPHLLPSAFAEFFRVLRPGGRLLLAFKAADQAADQAAGKDGGKDGGKAGGKDGVKRPLTSGYGHEIELDVYWFPPQRVADLMTAAGFTESLRLVRAAEGYEGQPQAYLLGVKPER
ncbi:class I SAM-dependent methyltransferase [Paractinoplanes durhamensis]|uniref:Methyltransferase n=1 Tax=Paractinoplanes durhamensis TaxID=113563 RepID=A0ABQ3ZCH1_9ACTN|nr:class I SAM-dependent methyltransferase [Actinoplanes durhamensis]GIE07517.1 methyltransferase [Actinoplanes durhamensis]